MVGKTITTRSIASPLGEITLFLDGDAIVQIDFDDGQARSRQSIEKRFGEVAWRAGGTPVAAERALADYFAGAEPDFEAIEVRTDGTAFQQRVWRALREIPFGRTWSYGQLAAHIGMPKAVRAVGRTNGLNPIAIIVPCHRVIGADGSLTGYGGGLHRKLWLLRHEGALLDL